MTLIQNKYIAILSFLTGFNNEKNRKVRYAVTGILFFLIFGFSFLIQMRKGYFDGKTDFDLTSLAGLHYADYRVVSITAVIAMLLMVLLMTEKPLKPVKWNFYFVITWFLLCALIIIAGMSHDIGSGYIITQIGIMFLIPAFSIIIENNDERAGQLFDTIAVVMIISLAIITIMQMVIAPFDMSQIDQGNIVSERYLGLTRNPNRLGEYANLGAIASFYLIYRKKGALKIIASITAGMCIAQSFMSVSRTSMLSICLVAVAWIIFNIKRKIDIKMAAVILLLIVASSVATYEITSHGTDPLNLRSDIQNEVTVYAQDDSSEHNSTISERLSEKANMDEFSSGRIAIWKMCVSKITWSGNDITYSYPLRVLNSRGDGYSYVDLMHNTALEFAFRCGWPVGIIIWGIELWALIFCLTVLFGKKERVTDAKVFCVFGILVFLVAGNVEPINEAFVRLTLLIFYFSIIPLFSFAADFDFIGFLKTKTHRVRKAD